MKISIKVNGATKYLEVDRAELLKALENDRDYPTGYERAKTRDTYWYVSDFGITLPTEDSGDDADYIRWGAANYYTNRALADANNQADVLMRRLRRFAAEHGGRGNFAIYLDENFNALRVMEMRHPVACGTMTFAAVQTANEAIDEYRDELIWYFTEYLNMNDVLDVEAELE